MRAVCINAPQALPGRQPDAIVLHVLGATKEAGVEWRRSAQAQAWRGAFIADALGRGLFFAFMAWKRRRGA